MKKKSKINLLDANRKYVKPGSFYKVTYSKTFIILFLNESESEIGNTVKIITGRFVWLNHPYYTVDQAGQSFFKYCTRISL